MRSPAAFGGVRLAHSAVARSISAGLQLRPPPLSARSITIPRTGVFMTATVNAILARYEATPPGVKANLYRMLMHGRLGGTGKMIILPVDQGFEHGPARSFAINPAAYDPHYHFQLAIDCRAQRLRRAARHARSRGRQLCRANPDDPETQQLEQLGRRRRSGGDRQRRRCAAARLRRGRFHHLSGQRRLLCDDGGDSRAQRGGQGLRARHRDLVIPARRQAAQIGRAGARRRRLCRAHGGAARRAYHQGQAAGRAYRTAGCQEGL